MYSQKPLLVLFHEGKVPGESIVPEHVETVISNVFLFDERVYKIYKNDNAFFNSEFRDISGKVARFRFSQNDFEWNHRLSPEVYLEVRGVSAGTSGVNFSDTSDAEELVIVTTRLPKNTVLYFLLREGKLKKENFFEIGRQFALRENKFGIDEKAPHTMYELMVCDCDDLDSWGSDIDEVSREEWGSWMRKLREMNEAILKDDTREPQPGFDIHSINAFFVDGSLIPLDTSPPKDSWRFRGTHTNAYRLAADILAFSNATNCRDFLRGYSEHTKRGVLKREEEKMWILFGSLIMMSYLFKLSRADHEKLAAAEKYRAFVREYTKL